MNQNEATAMVETALEQRRKFGKHFGVRDMPPEFLDALVIEFNRLKAVAAMANDAAEKGDKARLAATGLEEQVEVLHEQLVLLKRQLGAAKSRETGLRKQLAALADATQATILSGNSAE